MTYERSQHVQEVIQRLKKQSELPGFTSKEETDRLCQRINEMVEWNITDADREYLEKITLLDRRFTTAEANHIASMYGHYYSRRKK